MRTMSMRTGTSRAPLCSPSLRRAAGVTKSSPKDAFNVQTNLTGEPAVVKIETPAVDKSETPAVDNFETMAAGDLEIPAVDKIDTTLDSATQPEDKKPLLSHKLNETFATDELLEELKDNASLGRRGEIILAAQLIVSLLVVFPPMRIKGLIYLGGVLSIIAGAVTSLYAIFSLGRSFTPLVAPRKRSAVVKDGMFQYMRHPVYAGCILLAFGLAAVTYSESRVLLSILLTYILDFKSRREEVAMLERHGEEYETYMTSVSRFFPNLY